MTLKKINDKYYNIDDFVEYYKPDTNKLGGLPVYIVQPGFEIFVDGKVEFVYDVEYADYSKKNKQFYFLHIPKTGGMSIKKELLQSFKYKTVFSNFIQYIDDYKMLNSDFISGHFATYPLELFKQHNQTLMCHTVVREPTDRFLSNFLYYKRTILETKKGISKDANVMDLLEDYINMPNNHNVQYRHLTMTLDVDSLKNKYNMMVNKEINMNQYYIDLADFDYLMYTGSSVFDIIDRIDYVEVLELRKNFDRLDLILKDFGIDYNVENIIRNIGTESTADFKNKLSKETLNKIMELNQKDYEIYEYCIANRKAG